MAETFTTTEELLPQINADGGLDTPLRGVLATVQLSTVELNPLIGMANRFIGLQRDFGPINLGKDGLDTSLPWLKQWSDQMDEWITANGDKLTVPIQPDDYLKTVIMVDCPSPDHTDAWVNMPIGLSIGLEGERELVGVALTAFEECNELMAKLQRDGKRLWELDEVDGHEVQRMVQRKGTMVHIGGVATVHSGRPLTEENANFVIGQVSVPRSGFEAIAAEHMDRFYGDDGYLQTLAEDGKAPELRGY